MKPDWELRVDLGDLKIQIVKRIGPERSKRYFSYLNRLLSQKLSKSEFDKLCQGVLGRENLPLHNQFICSILKTACHAKAPPRNHGVGPTKSSNGPFVKERDPPPPFLSNGTVQMGPNGKAYSSCHQFSENGILTPCDYKRPLQSLHGFSEQLEKRQYIKDENRVSFSRSSLIAPLGIQHCSFGRTRRAISNRNPVGYRESDGLYDVDTMKKHMQQIAVSNGLEGISNDSASVLNAMLDAYLKRLIKSSAELAESKRRQVLQYQNSRANSISLLDFKVAMELNPQQLGEDWPLLLEKITMSGFEE